MTSFISGFSVGRIFKWLVFLAVAAVIVLAIYRMKFAPVEVTAHPLTRGEVIAEVMGTGTLEARVQTVVSSKISGRIAELSVDQGDPVRDGQVLARLDDAELRQQVEIARSTLEAAQAAVERSRSDIARSQALLDQADTEYQRNEKLFASRAISANDMDRLKTALDVAQADLVSVTARAAETLKNLAVAQNSLDYQLARLKDTVIQAPFSGLIVRRDRDPGDVVAPGSSIFLLIAPNKLWVSAWVDETEMSKLAPGQPARVVFRSEPETPYDGEVTRLGRETDRETRQFVVDVAVTHLPVNWSVGQRADVFIQTAHKKNVLTLPSRLLLRRSGHPGIITTENGRAVWRQVGIGVHGRDRVEVVGGLKENEVAIESRTSTPIPEGRKVKIVR